MDKYIKTNRKTSKGDMATDHFMLNNIHYLILNNFNFLRGTIQNSKWILKVMRIASVSDRNIHGLLIEAAEFADYKNIAIKTLHILDLLWFLIQIKQTTDQRRIILINY